MEISFFDDDIKPQGKKIVNGKPVKKARLIPDEPGAIEGVRLREDLGKVERERIISVYLEEFKKGLGDDIARPETILGRIKSLARNQGRIKDFKDIRRMGEAKNLELSEEVIGVVREKTFIENSVRVQKMIFDWIVSMPHRDETKGRMARVFEDWLARNFRADYDLARDLVRGSLGPVTAVDLLGGSKLQEIAKIKMDTEYDKDYAVDLRVDLGRGGDKKVFLIQVKTIAADDVDPLSMVVDLDGEKDTSFRGAAGRMRQLAREIAIGEKIDRRNVKRVLVTVPAMGTAHVERWTGFVRDEHDVFRKNYQEKLKAIGFVVE